MSVTRPDAQVSALLCLVRSLALVVLMPGKPLPRPNDVGRPETESGFSGASGYEDHVRESAV